MDLIERQDAIKAIGDIHPLDYSAQSIKTRIEGLPSAEPRCIANIHLSQEQLDEAFEKVKSDILSLKPKTGKWFIVEQDRYMVYSVRCSECNYNISWLANYCPNCGAKMEV